MNVPTTWILVADSARARILSTTSTPKTLSPVSDFSCDAAREKTSDRNSDRPGRVHESSDVRHHAMEPPTDPKLVEIEKFIKEVADRLNKDAASAKFDRLVVVASPKVLGAYRAEFGKNTQQRLYAEIPKTMTQLEPRELAEKIKESTDVWLGAI